MTADSLLAEVVDAGIRLSVNGDRLRVESKPGALSDALRARLLNHKPELLELLQRKSAAGPETRAHLVKLAQRRGLPPSIVEHLPDNDAAACTGLASATLFAYLGALDRRRIMNQSIVPSGYTQAVHCDGCGPVWLWPGCPPRVRACPWCFRRKAGKPVPSPSS